MPSFARRHEAVLQRDGHGADGAVAAHGQASRGLDEEDCEIGIRRDGRIEHRARHQVVAARLEHERPADPVVVAEEVLAPLAHGGAVERGSAARHHADGIAAGVAVDAEEGVARAHDRPPPATCTHAPVAAASTSASIAAMQCTASSVVTVNAASPAQAAANSSSSSRSVSLRLDRLLAPLPVRRLEDELAVVDLSECVAAGAVDVDVGRMGAGEHRAEIAGRTGFEGEQHRGGVVDIHRHSTPIGLCRDPRDGSHQVDQRIDHVDAEPGDGARRALDAVGAPVLDLVAERAGHREIRLRVEHRAEVARLQHGLQPSGGAVPATVLADREHHACLGAGIHRGLRARAGKRERLLAEDMLAGRGRRDHLLGMGRVRCGQDDRIDAVVGEHRLVGLVLGRAVLLGEGGALLLGPGEAGHDADCVRLPLCGVRELVGPPAHPD